MDWIRCDGYGLCGDLVPDLIDLDEWRYPILVPGPIETSRVHDAQRAVDCCPMKALALETVSADPRVWDKAGRSAGRQVEPRQATPMTGVDRAGRRAP